MKKRLLAEQGQALARERDAGEEGEVDDDAADLDGAAQKKNFVVGDRVRITDTEDEFTAEKYNGKEGVISSVAAPNPNAAGGVAAYEEAGDYYYVDLVNLHIAPGRNDTAVVPGRGLKLLHRAAAPAAAAELEPDEGQAQVVNYEKELATEGKGRLVQTYIYDVALKVLGADYHVAGAKLEDMPPAQRRAFEREVFPAG